MNKKISLLSLILVLFCGICLAGCNNSSGSLLLSLNSEKIELLITDEKADYIINLQNYSGKSVNFDFGFETNIAKIVDNSVQKIENGKYQFSIAPISAGSTTLKITLRGTAKSIDVPVTVSEELQSFTTKNEIFVRRGNSITLNNTYFSFIPENTTQKGLSFKLKNPDEILEQATWDEQTNTLFVNENAILNEITFIATSEISTVDACEFAVKVVSDINLAELDILAYSQNPLDNESFDYVNGIKSVFPYVLSDGVEKIDPSFAKDAVNTINLITNEPNLFLNEIKVETDFSKYSIDVYASEGIIGDISYGAPITNKYNPFKFVVQASKVSPKGEPYKLTFRVKQADFTANFKDVEVYVYATNVPKEIRINNNKELPTVELYHNNAFSNDFRFSIFPNVLGTEDENKYVYSLNVYTRTADGDVRTKLTDLLECVNMTYNGVSFTADENGYACLENVTNLNSVLNIDPKYFSTDAFVIKVECKKVVVNSETNEIELISIEVSNEIVVKVYRGTTKFVLSEGYENGVIYVPMQEDDLIFDKFKYDSGSTIGELIITSKNLLDSVCDVTYQETNTEIDNVPTIIPAIRINPKKVGESEYFVQTQNGLYVTIKIVVVREITEQNFIISIDDTKNNTISDYAVKEEYNNTLKNVEIRGIGSSLYVKDIISGFTDTNQNSYEYKLEFDLNANAQSEEYFELVNNNQIISKKFTEGTDVTVKVNLHLYKVDGEFKLVKNEVPLSYDFSFKLTCVDYYKDLNLTISDGDEKSQKMKNIIVYDKNSLSYTNQNLSTAYIYLDIQKSIDRVYSADFLVSNITISNENGMLENASTIKVGSVGYLYLNTNEYKEEDGQNYYIATFVCDISGTTTTKQFSISINLIDETGIRFTSFVTIEIGNYIDVESIYLTSAVSEIYFDATESYKTFTIGTYILPSNAMCQDIQVVIDTSVPNCITYTQNGNTITFKYNSGGSGTIRIFPVSKMKTSSLRDQYGNYYYHIAIDFIAADGISEDRALKLSSYEDVLNIKSNLHYYIDSLIDCKGQTIYIPTFTGSIRGTFAKAPDETLKNTNEDAYNIQVEQFKKSYQLGGITNFVVEYKGKNSGLFGTMSGKLYNLTFIGEFKNTKWELSESTSNIGLLCGTNNGIISDVQVTPENREKLEIASIIDNGESTVYLGMVAGTNHGTIATTNNAKISTLIVYMTEKLQISCIPFTSDKTTQKLNAYVGGVTGLNGSSGSILNMYLPQGINTIGSFGINSIVNLYTEKGVKYLSGVASYNAGTIQKLKVTGETYNRSTDLFLTNTYTAGLVAVQNGNTVIEENITRIFIRGWDILAGLVGAFSETTTNVDKIKGNKVQAIDDGTREGVNASMMVSYNQGNDIYSIHPKYNKDDESTHYGNVAESYVTRETTTNDGISGLDYYYGDIIEATDKDFRDLIDNFDKGVDDKLIPTAQTFMLAVYKQAEDSSLQTNIDNTVDLTNILTEIAGIEAKELNVGLSNKSLASLINFGQALNISGTGAVTITLNSSLNYKNSTSLNIYITNYFDDFYMYLDKDHIQSLHNIEVINTTTKNIYMGCDANVYLYKNTPINLKSNNEITFIADEVKSNLSGTGYEIIPDNEQILDISILGQTIGIVAKEQKNADTKIKITPVVYINNDIYFAIENEKIGAFAFVKDQSNSVYRTPDVVVYTGIENIQFSKYSVLAEPSNEIEFDVEYDSYNDNDFFVPVIEVYANGKTEKFEIIWEEGKDNVLGTLGAFRIARTQKLEEGTHFVDTYILWLDITAQNYKNYRNSTVKLTLTSNITKQSDYITVNYTPETITSVIINNYCQEENLDMIPRDPNMVYDESQMITSGVYSSSGEYNLLKTYVYTQLGEFDYLDISMNAGMDGGYLAIGKDGKINSNILYSSINGIVSLRAYKHNLISDEMIYDENLKMLEIIVVYSLPQSIPDNTSVPITLTFYRMVDDVEVVCYQKEVIVISRQSKRVEFTIYDQELQINTNNNVHQTYSVVKNKVYRLETNIVGYADEEVVFESSNPNIAYVSNEGGVYYLNITNINLTYGDKEYYLVTISTYGRKNQNNTLVKGRAQITELRIYEFRIDNNEPFETTNLALKLLNTVDVRDVVTNVLDIEYATYNTTIVNFFNSFKQNATWSVLVNGITRIDLHDSLVYTTTDFKLNNYNLQPLVIADKASYQICVTFRYTYRNGTPVFTEIGESDAVYSGSYVFDVEVYLNSNEELPTPIYNAEDLTEMQDGEYYRLVSDVTIDGSEFNMLTSKVKMLDGNGYKIIIKGDYFGYGLANISDFALFEMVDEDCIFKNIHVVLQNRKTIQIDNNYASNGVKVGIIASTNNGIITNCKVTGDSGLYVNVLGTVNIMENSYFGTICAENNGYISNSQVEADVSVSGTSIGGFVCNNNGQITSSYIKNSRIANTSGRSNEEIATGGFVCNNDGKISMSYIEGQQSSNKIYCDYPLNSYGLTSKIIYTSSAVGGFAYLNKGEISDSYSNIPVVSSASCAGFVAFNNGSIERVFSLSKMKERDTLNYGFVINYNENAVFKNCFFVLEPGVINDYTSETNYNTDEYRREYFGVIEGVEPLNVAEFNILDNEGKIKDDHPFVDFIVGETKNDTSGIWFYTFDQQKTGGLVSQKQTYLVQPSEFYRYDVNSKGSYIQSFSAGMLQLVSPNLLATSRYVLKVDKETYNYAIDDSAVAYGSKNNPYLIATAQDLEEYCNQRNSGNMEYYRLIKDIDYIDDNLYKSKLTDKTLYAYFEGNNFKISNYSINTSKAIITAGLFGQVGKNNGFMSTLKNVSFEPSYVNAPNSIYVGGVAGSLTQTKVYNIDIAGKDIIIVGKNIVGGLFGRTYGNVYIQRTTANVVTKSSQFNSDIANNKKDISKVKPLLYDESAINRADVSYSGAIVGYLGGASVVSRVNVGEKSRAFGVVSGLLFGGIGTFAKAKEINLELNSYENEIKAYVFGGIITGENNGTIEDIIINSDILHKELFSCYPITPLAIGGIAGYMANGTISNVYSSKGYSVIGMDFTGKYLSDKDGYLQAEVNNPYVVKYVGGIVGYLDKGSLHSVTILGLKQNSSGTGAYDIVDGKPIKNGSNTGKYDKDDSIGLIVSGGNYVGGVVGYSNHSTQEEITFTNKSDYDAYNPAYTYNISINLVGHKEYVNLEGNKVNEMIYMSYVSEQALNGKEFDETQKVGAIYLDSIKVIYDDSVNSKDETKTLYYFDESNCTITANDLYVYYAKYDWAERNANDSNIKYEGIDLDELEQKYINLTTGKAPTLKVTGS